MNNVRYPSLTTTLAAHARSDLPTPHSKKSPEGGLSSNATALEPEINPQENFSRLESAHEHHGARSYIDDLAQLAAGEGLADIEQELWNALDFDDIWSAMASELDEQAFICALREGDPERVLNLLQDAIEADIKRRAEEKHARELELAAEAREALEIEEAAHEWRMR